MSDSHSPPVGAYLCTRPSPLTVADALLVLREDAASAEDEATKLELSRMQAGITIEAIAEADFQAEMFRARKGALLSAIRRIRGKMSPQERSDDELNAQSFWRAHRV